MLLILLGAVAGVIVGAVTQKSVLAYGVVGAVGGLVIFGVIAASAPRPKVLCWTEAKGAEIFRAMPFICSKKVVPAR